MKWSNVIDGYRVSQLLRKKLTMKQIGKIIAKEQGREVSYQAESVRRALYHWRKNCE